MKPILLGVAAFLSAAAPAVALACSCIPIDPFYGVAEGLVPAEQGGIAVFGRVYDETMGPTIERDVDGAWEEIPSTLEAEDRDAARVSFDSQPGQYRLLEPNADGELEERLQFEVVEMGEVSGDLTVTFGDRDMVKRTTGSSECSTEVRAAERPLSFKLPEALEPFREALHYELLRDGEPVYYGDSTCDYGRREGAPVLPSTVYGVCDSSGVDRGSEQGEYAFELRVSLPGTQFSWMSGEQLVDLECSGVGGCATADGSMSPWALLGVAFVFICRRRR